MKILRNSLLVVAFMVSLLFVASNARASLIPIDAPNAALAPYPAPYAEVMVSLNSGGTVATITITGKSFNWWTDPVAKTGAYTSQYLVGDGSTIALNTNGAVNLVNSYGTNGFSWSGGNGNTAFTAGGSGNVSDFGTFNYIINNFDGFNSAVSSLSFQLQKATGSWTGDENVLLPNTLSNQVAAHIFVPNTTGTAAIVTGFAGNDTTGTPPVPVPPSVWLLGSGLIGLVGLRRRFKKGGGK